MTLLQQLTAAMWTTALTLKGHAELDRLTDAYRVQEKNR
jgi:hypothetical protein